MEQSPQTNTADRLRAALGENALEMLTSLVEQVKDNQGWGDIVIVIAEHRVMNLKVSYSYRPVKDVID